MARLCLPRQDLRALIGILFWSEIHEALLHRENILCFELLILVQPYKGIEPLKD